MRPERNSRRRQSSHYKYGADKNSEHHCHQPFAIAIHEPCYNARAAVENKPQQRDKAGQPQAKQDPVSNIGRFGGNGISVQVDLVDKGDAGTCKHDGRSNPQTEKK